MRLRFRKAVLLVGSLAGGLAMTGHAAGDFNVLHGFSGTNGGTNKDGAHPNGDLILAGDRLYGTAVGGGHSGHGTVFSLSTAGQGFTSLHQFSALRGPFLSETNSDGASPLGGLVLRSNVLYGTANNGGAGAVGTVFRLNIDGSEFSTLHSFVYTLASLSGGSFPEANPLLVGDTLYGTAQGGGNCDNGTVYRVNTDGSGYARLFDFCFEHSHHWTLSGLVTEDGTLYGCSAGGQGIGNSPGSVYRVRTDGSEFAVLHFFAEDAAESPVGRLVLSAGTLYGTTVHASGSGGTVFKLNADGAGFEVLHRFSGGSEGSNPFGVVLVENRLYGTTAKGGASGKGTVYTLKTDGTELQTLYSFTGEADGAAPNGGLICSNGKLYGATFSGGPSGSGTLFSLALPNNPPQLSITSSASSIQLSWPTNATGFILHSSANLGAEADWQAVALPTPLAIVDTQNVVILSNFTGQKQQFYRLRR